ncbi:MAG: SDR family NAD(P)-dependent oxidoreductase [Clostridia bacterium]|nr:SDR family NAD(P)-dependent oxidoreductase [Clostridia bacterium]
MKRQEKTSVLVTGAAAGIGKAVAEYFLQNGHTVYALDVRLPEVGEAFEADVTDEKRLREVKAALEEKGAELDAILNFAGVHTMGSFIEEEYSAIKRLFEINVLGAVLVNKTFHSLLKKDGRILITSSEVAAGAPLPFNGIYNVSKSAVDCYAHALRQELNLLGQKVVTLRPGSVETALAKGSTAATEKLCESTRLYKAESRNFRVLVERFTGKPMKAERLAAFVYKIVRKKHPKYVYTKNRHFGLALLALLPKRLQCFAVKTLVKK